MRSISRFIVAALCVLAATPAWACEHLVVDQAWIREAPPGAAAMAGYARLRNDGKTPLHLDAVVSQDFTLTEVHHSRLVDGQMRMRRIDPLVLAPGQSLVLAPGGDHLMLTGPKASFTGGGSMLQWHCGKQHSQTLFPVRKPE